MKAGWAARWRRKGVVTWGPTRPGGAVGPCALAVLTLDEQDAALLPLRWLLWKLTSAGRLPKCFAAERGSSFQGRGVLKACCLGLRPLMPPLSRFLPASGQIQPGPHMTHPLATFLAPAVPLSSSPEPSVLAIASLTPRHRRPSFVGGAPIGSLSRVPTPRGSWAGWSAEGRAGAVGTRSRVPAESQLSQGPGVNGGALTGILSPR